MKCSSLRCEGNSEIKENWLCNSMFRSVRVCLQVTGNVRTNVWRTGAL